MTAHQKDYQEYRQLWQTAFDDTQKYMDYYFERKAPWSEVWENRQDGQLCTMAFVTMYDAVLKGEQCCLPYIVGVATREERRHEGRMTEILSNGLAEKQRQGCPLAFLSPADPAIYEPLGFVPSYWRQSTILDGEGSFSLQVRIWEDLTSKEKQKASEFAEEQLQAEQFDLRLIHHAAYYEEVHRELRALEGGLLVFFEKRDVVGIANWIQEDGQQEVTELICRRDRAEKVLESLQAWVRGECLTIDDSMFISHLENRSGLRRQKQRIPYLMYRMLQKGCTQDLRCYVNDIT